MPPITQFKNFTTWDETMTKQHNSRSTEDKRYTLTIINRLGIGSIIIMWGSLLTLKAVGMIDGNVGTWPFAFTAFGILFVFGGIYRCYARDKNTETSKGFQT